MRGYFALGLVLFIQVAWAGVLFTRTDAPSTWSQIGRADPNKVVEFRVALKQQNIDKLEKFLLEVSDPASPNFGKHWSVEKINDLVSPSEAETNVVLGWLRSFGVQEIILNADEIKCKSTVLVAEKLFDTTMYVFENDRGRRVIKQLGTYAIPEFVAPYVDMVTGISDFPLPSKGVKKAIDGSLPGFDDINVYPALIRTAYNLPSSYAVNSKSSICLAEFQNEDFPSSFSASDVTGFYQGMGAPTPNTNAWTIVGPYNPPDNLAEATLDVEYGSIIGLNTSVWYWTSNGWMYEFSTDLANAQNTPYVVSMSWGWPEPWECSNGTGNCSIGVDAQVYVERVDSNFKKIGLRGISLLAASGDQGAPGDENSGCTNTQVPLSDIYPGGSPWVLSVGATMLFNPNTTGGNIPLPPICSNFTCATSINETACSIPTSLITSGGGFADFSLRPSWQDKYVKSYLNSGVTLPPSKYYNSTNRAFPDVSALGHGYLINWNSNWTPVDGTSASTPVFAAVVALLNSARFNAGKSSLGFLPPIIYGAYANDATSFNDITSGNNMCTEYCCATYGYQATAGWDPVTGLGTPNFPKLLSYVLSLP